jgi:hypothetical protein
MGLPAGQTRSASQRADSIFRQASIPTASVVQLWMSPPRSSAARAAAARAGRTSKRGEERTSQG